MGFGRISISDAVILKYLKKGTVLEVCDGLPRDARILNATCTQYAAEIYFGVMSANYSGTAERPSPVGVTFKAAFSPGQLDPKEYANSLTDAQRDDLYRYLHIVWRCRM